jgi:hypothetical protein
MDMQEALDALRAAVLAQASDQATVIGQSARDSVDHVAWRRAVRFLEGTRAGVGAAY